MATILYKQTGDRETHSISRHAEIDRVVIRVDEQAVDYTKTDADMFAASLAQFPGIASEVISSGRINSEEVGTSVLADGFFALYRNRIEPTEFGDPIQRIAIDALRSTPELDSIRDYTATDESAAYFQACSILPKIVASIPAETADAAEDVREKKHDKEVAEGNLEQAEEKGDEDEIDQARQALKNAEAALAEAEAALAETIDAQSLSAIRHAAKRAVRQAVEDSANSESFATFCGSGPGTPGTEDSQVALAYANAANANPQFPVFCELFGRLTSEVTARQLTKARHESGSAVDVTVGANLGLVDESEIAEMLDPDLAVLAEMRFFDEAMQQLEVEDLDDAGRGDLFILIDVSGSMDMATAPLAGSDGKPVSATRATQAKALGLAVARAMTKSRRHATIGLFDDDDKFRLGPVRFGPEDWHKTENGKTAFMSKAIAVAEFKSGGGTSFDFPISFAAKAIKKDGRGKPDILIVTDGDGSLSEQTIKAVQELRKSIGLRFYTIFVGKEESKRLVPMSDRTWFSDSIFGGVSSEVIESLV